ncbi:trans-L-3-hydroxyproline dehydratase-like [Diadema setosum]|uniref:trans-L-3-hydroxyproline dehydratase-like n=1 Tax=Diadema setosum TaxID=31175 RepID=UPI003B3AD7BF
MESIMDKSPYKVETIDMHTGGEAVRIVHSGYPRISGDTILAKRRYVQEHLDHYRLMLMHEPRGHNEMYGAVIVEPDLPEADVAVLFMHNEGYSTMCGHATISLGRYALDFGLVKPVAPETQVNLQCPCGLVKTFVEYDDQSKTSGKTRFLSVPAFAFKIDVEVNVPGFGKIIIDISYGGAFYAFVSADQLGLDMRKSSMRDITAAATAVTEATKSAVPLEHPDDPDLSFLYGTIVTDGKDAWSEEPTANICVFADAQTDRSPTGSGVTARIALQIHKGLIDINQVRKFQNSSTNSEFTGKAVERVKVGQFDAVVVEVAGKGHYIGKSTFISEEGDHLGKGFLVR